MTNLFALCLIATSLTAAGLWSHQQDDDDVIVKEGHRVVVVEYGDQGEHNTKVSISSEPAGQDASHSETRHRTRDVICDAFGKCKHKIASAVEKAKATAQDVGEAVKETVSDKSNHVRESLEKAKEDAKEALKEDKARRSSEKIKAGGNKLKENLRVLLDLERGVKVIKDSFRYLGWAESLLNVLSLLGFSMALGMGVWTTFISSYVLAIALPRQQLAVVQSKIYPVYFRAMASSIGMALFGHLFSHSHSHSHSHIQVYVLVAALLMIFANSLYLEPRATKVMFEKLKIEKEDITVDRELVKSRIVGLNKRLKNLNSYSSLLNLLTLIALACHLLYLSHRLPIP